MKIEGVVFLTAGDVAEIRTEAAKLSIPVADVFSAVAGAFIGIETGAHDPDAAEWLPDGGGAVTIDGLLDLPIPDLLNAPGWKEEAHPPSLAVTLVQGAGDGPHFEIQGHGGLTTGGALLAAVAVLADLANNGEGLNQETKTALKEKLLELLDAIRPDDIANKGGAVL